jgi:hypothetical protein
MPVSLSVAPLVGVGVGVAGPFDVRPHVQVLLLVGFMLLLDGPREGP